MEIGNRIAHLMRVGKVTAPANETGTVQTMQLTKSAYEVHDNVQSYQLFGFASSPMAGTCDAVVINQSGDNNRGVIIATNDRAYRPLNLNEGEVKLYDAVGNYVYLQQGQIIAIYAAQEIVLTSPTVRVNGNLQVSGTITAQGDVTGNGISLDHHTHGNVQNGSGTTGAPEG